MRTPIMMPRDLLGERIYDFRYVSASQILMPASRMFIGAGNELLDAELYTANDLTFSFGNGTGDNGLDTGVESQDQWYALYAVPNAANTGYILKASVNPPPQAGGAGPTGYTKYRYLGVFRNGGNAYDTTSGYGRGDIARFIKTGQTMWWQHFNSVNGGQYPAAPGTQCLVVYVANTATNGTVFDGNNAASWGFGAFNAGGGIKLPYRYATYKWSWQNNSDVESYVYSADSAGNTRRFVGATPVPNSTVNIGADFWQAMSQVDPWVSQFLMVASGNPNVSRIFGADAMIDPYL